MPGTIVATTAAVGQAGSGQMRAANLGKRLWAAKWWIVTALATLSAFWLHRRERLRLQVIEQQTDPRLKHLAPLSSVRNDGRPSRALAGEKGPWRGMLYFAVGIVVVFLLLVKPGPVKHWFSSAETEQPCRMTGVWLSSRSGSEITLNADGSYITAPTQDENGIERIYQGKWKISGDKMIWTHFGKETVTEANPIKEESDGHFTLIEENGDSTRFKLQKTVESARCTH